MATGEQYGRNSKSRGVVRAATRALRGARDLYVRGAKGLGKFIVAANPRAGVAGRPTSRVFGRVGELNSEQELRELVRDTQLARCDVGAGAGGKKAETAAPAAWRHGNKPLGRIDEDGALVHDPTK
uniref:Uncharacterized protein n=1 Tax=Leersia perrieri TaxID=77586 RepID=A0A0D9VXD2_9ORYZ